MHPHYRTFLLSGFNDFSMQLASENIIDINLNIELTFLQRKVSPSDIQRTFDIKVKNHPHSNMANQTIHLSKGSRRK